jgi:hypothetical protein
MEREAQSRTAPADDHADPGVSEKAHRRASAPSQVAASSVTEEQRSSESTGDGSLEMFACILLSCRVTVSACVKRRRAAREPGRGGELRIVSPACLGCVVGEAHERGERPSAWADGRPVVRLPIAGARPSSEETGTMARQITHNGITDSLAGWGRRLGLTSNAIGSRLKSGMTVAEALSTPKLSPTEAGHRRRTSEPAEKPAPKKSASPAKPAPAQAQRDAKPAKSIQRAPVSTAAAATSDRDPVDVLRMLGWDAENAGAVPAGQLVLVRRPLG